LGPLVSRKRQTNASKDTRFGLAELPG
jgi:hypothetical protein